tara:strand:+ start:931 stop:1845 length:915 start_codon:yes stop_codon:yes gene_type:complete
MQKHKRSRETTQVYLENQPLPNHGKSYTVVSHREVIENTKQLLENSGFTIRKEIYRANTNAQVAQGIYHIHPTRSLVDKVNNESELGMMFAWTNSYDKSIRFQCAMGAYVMVCSNGMMCGDMMNFKRKHTGTAGHDIVMQLSNQIKTGEKHYTRILDDRDELRNITLTKRQQSELLGRLFADDDIITSSQMSIIKKEMKKPSYDYNCNDDNAWTFYNHVTHSLKVSTPRDWMQDSQNFHDFMMNNVLGNLPVQAKSDFDWQNVVVNNNNSDVDTTSLVDIQDHELIEVDENISEGQLLYEAYTK